MDSLTLHPDAARKLAGMVRLSETTPLPYPGRSRGERMFMLSSGQGQVAITTVVIPARSGKTPGGPVLVQPQRVDPTTGLFVPSGNPLPVRSWVQSPSADPAGQPDGELWIFIVKDPWGHWWFVAQDCTMVPATIIAGTASADTVIGSTITAIPGTGFTITAAGLHSYILNVEATVTGIPGNQSWDIAIGIYDTTDGVFLASFDWAGGGEPPFNPRTSFADNLSIAEAAIGHTLDLRAVRSTTTGTITIQAPETSHSILGPIK